MTSRAWLVAAAITGFLSVAAGAAAAHLAAAERPAALLRTGALYGMVHAAALVAITGLSEARARPDILLTIAGWGFAAGILLFSLSLFALALGGSAQLALITPFGGAGLLLGWAALGVYAVCHLKERRRAG